METKRCPICGEDTQRVAGDDIWDLFNLMGDTSSAAGPPHTHTIQPEPALRWVRQDGARPVPPLHNDATVDESGELIVVDDDGVRCYLSE